MKRIIIYTAACLVAFASCQKQEVAEAPSQVEVAVELTASAAADATKTVMTEYNAHWWSVSDKISLFYTVEGKTGHSVFTSKNYIPAASAKFAGSLSLPAEDTDLTTVSALAVYPATTADASDGTSVNVTVPSVQTAVEGSFMEGAYPVVANTSDLTAALSFKAVCGGVKVSFQTPGITSFTFDAKGAKIAGTASVKISEDGTPVATLGEGAASVITVNAPAGGFEVGKWYYMTAFPATLTSGYTVTLSNGKSFGGSSSIAIKRSVFGVLDSKDAPDKYADIKANLKPISWWDENKDYMVAPVHAAAKNDQYQWDNQGMKCSYVRFTSDSDYIYGYYEGVVKMATYNNISTVGKLKNLGVWLDIDGKQLGTGNDVQGGGWLFNAYKVFDVSIYGPMNISGNMEWTTSLHTQTSANDANIGALKKTNALPAYGEGVLDNDVFKYSFVIDRRVVGLRSASKTVAGICFDDGSISNYHLINPDRAGYIVPLKSSDTELTVNELKILQHVKSLDYWDNIAETPSTNAKSSHVKIDSDADYIYGYFEVTNTDNLYLNEGSITSFDPGFVNSLAVGFDLDGISSGQGVGWMFGSGYDTMLSGSIANYSIKYSDDDTANGWYNEYGFAKIKTEKFEAAPRPSYSIKLGSAWNPIVTDCSKANGNVGKVIEEAKDWKNVATGNGEWKDKKFRYTFTIDRYRLGLKGLDSVKMGVMTYHSVSGYSVVPNVSGFTIKLNN